MEHVERVKWYAPHVFHVVADVRCKTDPKIVNRPAIEVKIGFFMQSMGIAIGILI